MASVSGTLNQIYSDTNYVFAATNRGLSIISMAAEEEIGYIDYNTGFSTTWGNDNKVYLGTTSSGIKYINKTCISGTVDNPEDLITCLTDYVSPFGISSQTIRYIHGSGDDYLMCCTNNGVDVYYHKQPTYRSSTTISGAQKCFMTQNGFYYTVSGTNEWTLNRVNKPLWDWAEADYTYSTGGSILPSEISINDIFVTENTSENGVDNTVFCATSSGTFVIDEGSLEYAIYLI